MGPISSRPFLLYLDTNVFINAVEGRDADERCRVAKHILHLAKTAQLECMTSELTLAEVLTPPKGSPVREPTVKRAYLALLVFSKLVRLEPLVRSDMYESARLASFQKRKVRLPDRLHLAVAIRANASHFVSHDGDICCPDPMIKFRLNERDVAMLAASTNSE